MDKSFPRDSCSRTTMVEWLRRNGYTGLRMGTDDCHCELRDLVPCDGVADECMPDGPGIPPPTDGQDNAGHIDIVAELKAELSRLVAENAVASEALKAAEEGLAAARKRIAELTAELTTAATERDKGWAAARIAEDKCEVLAADVEFYRRHAEAMAMEFENETTTGAMGFNRCRTPEQRLSDAVLAYRDECKAREAKPITACASPLHPEPDGETSLVYRRGPGDYTVKAAPAGFRCWNCDGTRPHDPFLLQQITPANPHVKEKT